MGIVITILKVLLVIDCLLLIGIILLQRGKGQGLAGAFGVGGMEEALGTHAASTAQKITVVLAVVFLSICIILGVLSRYHEAGIVAEPAVETTAEEESAAAPETGTTETPAPAAPVAPTEGGGE